MKALAPTTAGWIDPMDRTVISVSAAFGELRYALSRPLRAWVRRRRMAADLERLEDRMLHDAGIDPGEIAATARLVVARMLPKRQGVFPALGAYLHALGRQWQAAWMERAALRTLSQFDDRLLRDIGLSRGMIGVLSLGLSQTGPDRAATTFVRSAFRGGQAAQTVPSYRSAPSRRPETAPAAGETANDNTLRRAS